MKLKRWVNAVIQILGLAGQMLIPYIPLDQATLNLMHVGVGFLSAALGVIAHELDPTTGSQLPIPKKPPEEK
jgi:hypothetical protein